MTLGSEIETIVAHLREDEKRLTLREGEKHLTRFVVTFTEGIEEHRGGTLQDARELATEHGLAMVPTVGGWFHWVRDHDAWWDSP